MYIDCKSLKALLAFIVILSAFFIYFIISEGIDNDRGANDRKQAAADRETANIRGNITDAKLNQTIDDLSNTTRTLDNFIKAWYQKQILDNIRFNTTLSALNEKHVLDDIRFNKEISTLNKTYDLIVGNQKRIIALTNLQINLTDFQNNNTAKNLNLTKFNRAALVNTNEIVREIAKQLNITNMKPFNSSAVS